MSEQIVVDAFRRTDRAGLPDVRWLKSDRLYFEENPGSTIRIRRTDATELHIDLPQAGDTTKIVAALIDGAITAAVMHDHLSRPGYVPVTIVIRLANDVHARGFVSFPFDWWQDRHQLTDSDLSQLADRVLPASYQDMKNLYGT